MTSDGALPGSTTAITLVVNGAECTGEAPDHTLLVDYLRENRGLTGTKVGCDTATCGACSVLLDGQAVKSCTVLAAAVDGRTVTTIEGVAGADLHPLQRAFSYRHAVQCGFCTPGFVIAGLSLVAGYRQSAVVPDAAQIREDLSGNLCRCTGYQAIVEAMVDVLDEGTR